MMTILFWLSVLAGGLAILIYSLRLGRSNDLGTVSAQWLQEHRRETHRDL